MSFSTTPTLHDSIGAKRHTRREARAHHVVRREVLAERLEAIKAKAEREYAAKMAARWADAKRTVFPVPEPLFGSAKAGDVLTFVGL